MQLHPLTLPPASPLPAAGACHLDCAPTCLQLLHHKTGPCGSRRHRQRSSVPRAYHCNATLGRTSLASAGAVIQPATTQDLMTAKSARALRSSATTCSCPASCRPSTTSYVPTHQTLILPPPLQIRCHNSTQLQHTITWCRILQQMIPHCPIASIAQYIAVCAQCITHAGALHLRAKQNSFSCVPGSRQNTYPTSNQL
jgi:hypothetical protein